MKHTFLDEYSQIDSFIHRLDPRIKLITFIAFILFIIFTRPTSFIAFALYALLIASLIIFSKVPVKFILMRSFTIIPFVLMVAVFNINYSGLVTFWNVLIKAYLCVVCMTLLMATARFTDLLKALGKLRFPGLITMILSFMYRYIFVVQDELMKMIQAKESRSVGGSLWLHIKTHANMLGVLFVRAYERAESVYLAMCSRGFDGQIKTMDEFGITKKDISFLVLITVLLAVIRLIPI
ncbi:MAG: cobalt ECF transporter T component CbiQ [Candidatus Omnitrophica bacterium]|nr:cobalt ECF transporter T component CbiQ [Candidatus Omnitrophota bacterium]